MSKKLLSIFIAGCSLICFASIAKAQTGAVGIGTDKPNDKSVLEIFSNSKGVLIPRLTQIQRDNLQTSGVVNSEINGLLIYNATSNRFNYWLLDKWVDIGEGTTGVQGTQWYNGTLNPPTVNNEPVGVRDGDLYLNNSTGNAYKRSNGTWTLFANLASGIVGPKGDKGDIGIQGLKGDSGLQGIKGDTGLTGLQGSKGDTGLQGLKGDIGAKGDQGIQGLTGIQGVKGDVGQQGIQGLKGDIGGKGDQGIQGLTGLQGLKGDVGQQGIQGLKGDTGLKGDQGIQGLSGSQGLKGDMGLQGSQGVKGDTGINGSQGPKGEQGLQGLLGPTGLQGTKGDTGIAGPTGPQGLQGDQGLQGVKGDIGSLWYSGSGAPSLALGIINDFYLNNLNGDVYKKGNTIWTLISNIKGPSSTDAWKLSGNSGTNPAFTGVGGSFIGTLDVKDFVFGTSGEERMRISANGNVGINQAQPEASLHVNGTFILGQNGSVLNKVVKFQSTITDISTVLSNTAQKHYFTVADIDVGATVNVTPEFELPDGISISYSRVSAQNTIEVKFFNASTSAQDPVPMKFNITVVQ